MSPHKIRVSLICTAVSLGAIFTARAEDLHCDRYLPLLQSSGLSDDLVGGGISALTPDGGAFRAGDSRQNAFKLKLDANKEIPEACKKILLAPKATFTGVARGTLDGQPARPFIAQSDEAADLVLNYEAQYYTLLPQSCMDLWLSKGRQNQEFKNCVTNSQQTTERNVDSQIRRLNPDLPEGGGTVGFITNSSQARVIQAYHATLWSKNQTEALAYLSSVKNKLNTEEKLTLVQMFGNRFLRDYDKVRSAALASPNQERVVDFDQVLGAARGNTRAGISNYWLDMEQSYAGVCRDISSAQGQMLEALGFRNTYVVSYTLASGSYHVSVITQDPEKDTKVYRLNYGERSNQLFGDNRALQQGPSDISLNYRVFKPAGAMVANVPSELGKFLSEAAGFDVRNLDPLARTRSAMLGFDLGVGSPTNPTQMRGGIGRDGNGVDYAFVGLTQSWGQNSRFPGRAGLVIASTQRPGAYVDGSTGKPYNLDLIYMQLEQGFKSKDIPLSSDLSARIEAQATAIFMLGRARQDGNPDGFSVSKGDISAQGDLRLSAGMRVNQKSWRDRFVATYYAGVQSSPGILDIRDNRIDQVPILALNHFVLSAEGRLRLSKTAEGRAYLVAATAVLINELGSRGRIEFGIATDGLAVLAALEGRLSSSSAPYEDGSERRVSTQLVWRPNKAITLGIGGSMPLEGRDTNSGGPNLPLAPSANGSLGIRFW